MNYICTWLSRETRKNFVCTVMKSAIKKIIKAYSIQNNKILSKLAIDGHVYVAEFNANKFGGLDFKKVWKK